MKKEEFSFSSSEEGKTVGGELYLPNTAPQAILQFAHGMSDYGARYHDFFEQLANSGYIVAYSDHLGHGKTVDNEDDYGYFAKEKGFEKVIRDFNRCYDILAERFPNLPHFVMGHSMGSFIVRCFLASGKSDGAVLMGTGNKNPLAGMGIFLAKTIGLFKGERYRSVLLMKLSFGQYNKRIEDSSHQWAWLSHDKQAQQNILDDKQRNKMFTASAFKDLFSLVKYANDDRVMNEIPKDLPILFISGESDPLGPYEEGIRNLAEKMGAKGFQKIDVHIVKNARHELCHEVQRQEVFDFIESWLNRQKEREKH